MITNACRSLFRRTARPRTLRRRDGRRAGVGRLGVSALVVVVAQLAVAAALAAPPVHTFDLGAGYAAQVRADGGLWVGSGATPLLEAIPRDITTGLRQRHRAAVPFTAVTAEGAPGGQRGFSVRRDDDQDGRVDEDRLDGRDNDGDGLIDEDFAAMGDAMAVVSPDPAVHFTYVHWNAAHLGSLLFLMAEAPTGAYGIDLGRGAWSEQTLVAERHDLTGRPETARATAFVGRPDAADAPWIGVIVLDPGPVPRVVLEDARLDIRLQDKALPVAIAIAPTRMQLSRMLNEAVRVRRGVVDRVTGERAAWIAPPLCARCRLAESAAATWRRDDHGRLHLTMSVAADRSGAVDPDLFRIGGRPLGPVSEIRWEPNDGPGRTLVWDATARAATPAGPWRELAAATAHGAVGRLEFVFPRDESLSRLVLDGRLEGVYRDGRPFRAELAAAPVMAGLGGEASVSAEA
ncbi:hypothetical protein KDM41_13530, partial [bacterium]|nr:hypothetical protein [bacterium]